MRGLYAIVDTDALHRRGIDVVAYASALLAARPAALQLRDKTKSARQSLAWLRLIAPIAASFGVPFFANDRPDLALLGEASGVHVGQEDVLVEDVRHLSARAGASLLVGLSTHTEAELVRGVAEDPDYLAIGPIFGTQTKLDAAPTVGLPRLRALAERARSLGYRKPLCAIGGITLSTVADVAALVDVVAVIGALLPESSGEAAYVEAKERAAALHDAILETTLEVQ